MAAKLTGGTLMRNWTSSESVSPKITYQLPMSKYTETVEHLHQVITQRAPGRGDGQYVPLDVIT